MLADSPKQNERLKDILSDDTSASLFIPVEHTLHEGFTDEDLHLCLFTDHQIFDRFHKYSLRSDHARDTKMALTLKELMLFEPGDFIVHIDNDRGRLRRLGTGAWEKMKERTKKRIKDIARDLIRLYSRRREEKGFAFSHDSFMQHELEAGFAYEDTPDQLKVTQEVKTDMESPRPMGRLESIRRCLFR